MTVIEVDIDKNRVRISIHTPAKGVTTYKAYAHTDADGFQSTLPRRE